MKCVSKIDKRSLYSQKVMEDAFREIMNEKKFEDINVTEICQRAEVNRGTFYKHYDDMEDLLRKLEDKCVAEIEKLYVENFETKSLRQLFKETIEIFRKIMSSSASIGIARTQSLMERVVNIIKPRIVSVMDLNDKELSTEEEYYFSLFILGGFSSTIASWLKNPTISSEELCDIFAKIITGKYRL